MEGREEEELREVRGGERRGEVDHMSRGRGRHGYPDGFRRISGVLERLEILGITPGHIPRSFPSM